MAEGITQAKGVLGYYQSTPVYGQKGNKSACFKVVSGAQPAATIVIVSGTAGHYKYTFTIPAGQITILYYE